MAPIPSQHSRLLARDIASYSDTELDQYLEDNGRLVDVEDPENLPEDFIQRLRLRAGASATAQSRPVDLDDLTTRLEEISADRQAQPRSTSPHTAAIGINVSGYIPPLGQRASDLRSRETTEPLDEEEDHRRDLADEMEYYNTLIREGGQPSHPVSLGCDILEHPGEYREILSYWQLVNQDAEGRVWKVFGSQMCEWQRFRKYQRSNREEGRFPKYVEVVKRGLARHAFTRPFQLDEDLERQDKLTTWIEYLDYEYWKQDKDMRFVKRHQQQYDEAWQELMGSQVLRPFETEGFICNIDSAFQHASERERAEKAVESAKLAIVSARKATTDPSRSNLSQTDAQQHLEPPQYNLDVAMESLESIKRRNDLIYQFHKKTGQTQIVKGKLKESYQTVKHDAERRSILLQWILEQVPLIEAESNLAKEAKNNLSEIAGRRKSKRNRTDESNDERVSKRQKVDSESKPISNRKTSASPAKGYRSKLKRNIPDNTSDATNSTSIREPLPSQPATNQDSKSVEVRNPRARSPSRKERSVAKTPSRIVLGEARIMKRGRRGGNFNKVPTSGCCLQRRSTRMRKLPERF